MQCALGFNVVIDLELQGAPFACAVSAEHAAVDLTEHIKQRNRPLRETKKLHERPRPRLYGITTTAAIRRHRNVLAEPRIGLRGIECLVTQPVCDRLRR